MYNVTIINESNQKKKNVRLDVSMLHFYLEYIDLPGVCMQKFVMIHWILQ